MEEQTTTWKGHTFTLLVFTGIVVLASIFFILGMLVGRAQGQKIASTTPTADILKTDAKSDAKPEPKDDKPNFTFYDSVKKEQPAVLEPAPKKPPETTIVAESTPKASSAPPPPPPPVTSKPENVVNYQIGAVRKAADAEKLLETVKSKGFKAFILSPPTNDPNPFFRVQVGPFSDAIQAEDAKQKLEAAGYKPILKK
jgi:cell division protein FtsN